MGGATVLLAANEYMKNKPEQPIDAIVIDSSFAHFQTAVTGWLIHKLPFLKLIDRILVYVFHISSFLVPQFYLESGSTQPCDAIKNIDIPILLAHGSSDTVVSIEEAHKLLQCHRGDAAVVKMHGITTFFHDGVHVAAFRYVK